MDFLRISETKMKITLDQSDLERFRVAASALDYEDPATRRAFRAILDAAREESGFDVAGGKALIQCYPCKDGGCELFVTKLGAFPEVTDDAILSIVRQIREVFVMLGTLIEFDGIGIGGEGRVLGGGVHLKLRAVLAKA